jgi:hypothetical protein
VSLCAFNSMLDRRIVRQRDVAAFGNCVVLRATCRLSVERWRRRGRDRQYICYYRAEREGNAVPSRSYAIDGRLWEVAR